VASSKLAVEIWSPLPPEPSGVADYVEEQLEVLNRAFALTLVVENAAGVDPALRARFHVVDAKTSDKSALRVYHVGNSPLHGFAHREALRVPGVVFLHEWNLHELLLGFAVTSNNFDEYRLQMRREHGARGSIAAETIASALGGRHWTSVFPLNAEILQRALGVVSLSGSTAAKVAARLPGGRLLHLPHHSLLRSHTVSRSEARKLLGFEEQDRIVLLPGLGTAAKSFHVAGEATRAIRGRVENVRLVTVGGGPSEQAEAADPSIRQLGRVDLQTLGDALLAADVVLALRFPSRGEASGVLMRALAAGRASIVSAGSTADLDLPLGIVGRVNPGPHEVPELAALLEFLLKDEPARLRMESLARAEAALRGVDALTDRLVRFVKEIAASREELEGAMAARASSSARLRQPFRNDIEAAASSLGLTHLPANVFERLAGL
jgi:glycosyltransferase involved in cell wall biosynthesis